MNWFTSENALINQKGKCRVDNISTKRSSNESHIQRNKPFQKSPLYFRIYADFEADNELDISTKGNKTTNIYRQNPVLNSYQIKSELDDVLQSCCYESPLGYNIENLFVKKVFRLENKLTFYFKNTKKNITMTQEDKEDFDNKKIRRFCEKMMNSDKVLDHLHLTGKYLGPAHSILQFKCYSAKKKIFLFHSYFTILLFMIVICSSNNSLI